MIPAVKEAINIFADEVKYYIYGMYDLDQSLHAKIEEDYFPDLTDKLNGILEDTRNTLTACRTVMDGIYDILPLEPKTTESMEVAFEGLYNKDIMGYEPPYKPGTMVAEIELTENTTFVRVYDKANSRMQGGWVMKAEDIAGLTPQEIQNKFALPNTPQYVCDVNPEVGTRLRTGEVNPLFGFDGGGQQYDLIINGKNVGTFTNEKMIGQ